MCPELLLPGGGQLKSLSRQEQTQFNRAGLENLQAALKFVVCLQSAQSSTAFESSSAKAPAAVGVTVDVTS